MAVPDFVQRGRALSAEGRHLEAVKVCRLGLLANPSNYDGRLVLGRSLLALNRFDEVLAEVRVVLQNDLENEAALLLKGEALLGRGDAALAVDVLSPLAAHSASPQVGDALARALEVASNAPTRIGDEGDTSVSWTRDYPAHHPDADSITTTFGTEGAMAALGIGSGPTAIGEEEATFIEPRFSIATADTMLVGGPARRSAVHSAVRKMDYDADSAVGTLEVNSRIIPSRSAFAISEEPTEIAPELAGDISSEISASISTDVSGADISSAPLVTPKKPKTKRRAPLPPPSGSNTISPGRKKGSDASIELSASDLEPLSGSHDVSQGDETDFDEPSELELSSSDLIPTEDASSLLADVLPGGLEEVRGFDADFGKPSDPTHAYGGVRGRAPSPDSIEFSADAPLFLEREPDRPKSSSFPTDVPRPLPTEPQMTVPETPRARLDAPAPMSLPALPPEVSDLFPEEEDGVSKLELVDPMTGLPRSFEKLPRDQRPPPPAVLVPNNAFGEPQFGDGLPGVTREHERGRHDDMRTIRAGLGMSPDPSQQQIPTRREVVVPASFPQGPPPARPHSKPPSMRFERRRETSVGRPGLPLLLVIALGVVMVVGGVAGGVMLRGWRVDRGLDAALARAEVLASSGNYLDHLRARSLLARAAELSDRADVSRARARLAALLAAEFGVLGDARSRIAALGESETATALEARAYLALATGNNPDALGLATKLLEKGPRNPVGHYLRGLALAELGRLDAASKALAQSGPSPLAIAHLADVQRASGKADDAIASAGDSDVPAPAIARARARARAGKLPEGDEPESSLRRFVSDGALPPAAQEIGVSPRQALTARLALVEVAIVRGKPEIARAELEALGALEIPNDARFRIAYAEALLETGGGEAAAEQLSAVQKAWPTSPRTQVLTARIALAVGNVRGARAALEAIENIESMPRALAVRGQLALGAGRINDARIDLDKALAAAPGLPEAVLSSARVDLQEGKAKAALRRLESLPAGLFGTARDVVKAQALRADNRLEQARALLENAASSGSSDILLELARLERDSGRVAQAGEAFNRALKANPNNVEARLERALLDLDDGDARFARSVLDDLAKARANDPQVLLAAARARTLLGDAGSAGELVDAAEAIPGAPAWLVARERGRSLLRQRIFDKALAALAVAVAERPSDAQTHFLILEAHINSGDEAAARAGRAAVKAASTPLSDSAALMQLRGMEALIAGNAAAAYASFLAAREMKPESASKRARAELAYWIGRGREIEGDIPGARAELRRAIKLLPHFAAAYLVLGDVHLADNKTQLALISYGKAADLDPVANPRAFLQLGYLHAKANRRLEAKKALEQYLELDPKGAGATEARELLQRIK